MTMPRPLRLARVTAWPVLTVLITSACTTLHTASYRRDVHPVLESHCLGCHTAPAGKGYQASGLDMSSHAGLLRGSLYGRVVTPGNSRTSILMMLVEGRADPTLRMPHDTAEPLPPADIAILRQWIDLGARDN